MDFAQRRGSKEGQKARWEPGWGWGLESGGPTLGFVLLHFFFSVSGDKVGVWGIPARIKTSLPL